MNVNIQILRFQNSRYFVKCVFLAMVSSDGKGLSQLYLDLFDVYKKIFMIPNGQVAVLKCYPIWKKMRKSCKALSDLKLKFIPKAWKREAMAHKTMYSQDHKTRDSNLNFILFYLNLTIWFSCLKTSVNVSWVGAYVWVFIQLQKTEINDKGEYLCQA